MFLDICKNMKEVTLGIRKRRARDKSKTHIVGFSIGGMLGFVALLTIALFASIGGLVDIWLQDLPDYKSANSYLVAEPTQVYDSEGNVIADYYLQNRRSVDIEHISPYVLKGVVDTEDVRFYKHNGVDPQGIARAVLVVAKGGHEGASTITQQLVRNTILSDEQFEKTIKRKVREAYIATEMEKIYTKEQILNMYLNTIYYGHGAYGIEAASLTYFNKHADELTLPEAATLAGLPQSPSYYDPTQNPKDATTRRNQVLGRMLTVGDITKEEYDKAVEAPMEVNEGTAGAPIEGSYPYFTQYVKSILEKDFDNKTIMQGGLKIYTTIDPKAQKAAEAAVQKTLNGIGDDELEQAVVVMEPSTGYIKAMIGGRQWDAEHQFNLATQGKRQPGSSFKAFTLAAAIDNGMNPNTIINCNSPLQVSPRFKVQNYGNISYGNTTLKHATAVSSNTGYVQVALAVGNDKVAQTAKNLGIKSTLPTYDSLTLGSIELAPLEMCEAYNTLAAEGQHRDAVCITKIEDRNGNIVYQHKDSPNEAIKPQAAYAATQVLEGVLKPGGTAYSMRGVMNINQPVAGKTGTTSDYHDLWFCGYTPQYTMSVWTGYRTNHTIYVHGSHGHPYNTSCLTFGYFMNEMLSGAARVDFKDPGQMKYKPQNDWKFIKPIYEQVEEEPLEQEVPQENIEAPEDEDYQQNQYADDQNQQPQPQPQPPTENNGQGNIPN